MSQISANIDGKILEKFREIIFYKYGLRKGDFKKALEESITDYIQKYQNSQQNSEN